MAMTGKHGGHAKPFWEDAWDYVKQQNAARLGLVWAAFVFLIAMFAPLIANGNPYLVTVLNEAGEPTERYSPLWDTLSAGDIFGIVFGIACILAIGLPGNRGKRLRPLFLAGVQGGASTLFAGIVLDYAIRGDAPQWLVDLRGGSFAREILPALVFTVPFFFLALILPIVRSLPERILVAVLVALVVGAGVFHTWGDARTTYSYRTIAGDIISYETAVQRGEISIIRAPVPFSPLERYNDRDARNAKPLTTEDQTLAKRLVASVRPRVNTIQLSELDKVVAELQSEDFPLAIDDREAVLASFNEWRVGLSDEEAQSLTRSRTEERLSDLLRPYGRLYVLGTNGDGQDVFTHMIHACRLAISIGLVSTAIAVTIGIIIGALMGYFGGLMDLLLYRLVEIFQAIPVLFLLIVAAGVLPRNIYVMMAILGCFGWTGSARFTRAEFLKLRSMDFVQSCRAVGLPLRSTLFKHMLPNGVTPVLVASSFAIASAISFEAVLSFLGLGPVEQASWGRLIAFARAEGLFYWWLAVFPTLAIFLTVLSFVLIGEAFRDAIDPKRKKARS
ncbi:MAG: ABC transporter permease, partial [Planctomycetota bacterium]